MPLQARGSGGRRRRHRRLRAALAALDTMRHLDVRVQRRPSVQTRLRPRRRAYARAPRLIGCPDFHLSFHSRHEATSIRQHTPVPATHTTHMHALQYARCAHTSLRHQAAAMAAAMAAAADQVAAARGQQCTPQRQPPSQPPSHVAACHGRCGAGAGPDPPRPRKRARVLSGGSRSRGLTGDRRPSRITQLGASMCVARPSGIRV